MDDLEKIEFLRNYVRENTLEAREAQHREIEVDPKYERLVRLVNLKSNYGCQTSAVKDLVREILFVTTGERPLLDEKSKMSFKEIHGPFETGEDFTVIVYKPSGTLHLLYHENQKTQKIGISKDDSQALYSPTNLSKTNFYDNYRYATSEEIEFFIGKFNWQDFLHVRACRTLFNLLNSMKKSVK